MEIVWLLCWILTCKKENKMKIRQIRFKNLISICTMLIIMASSIVPLNIKAVSFSSAVSAEIKSGNVYYLKNHYSNQYLELRGSSMSSDLYQYDYMGSAAQQFKLILVEGSGDDAYYNIVPLVNEELRLDIDNALNQNGTAIKSYKINDPYSRAQLYKFIDNKDGSYRIMPKLSNSKVLEIAGPSQSIYSKAQIWDYVGADNQKWIIAGANDLIGSKKLEFTCMPYINPKGTTSISLHLKNNSKDEISYGLYYEIQKYNGTSWEFYYRPSDVGEVAVVLPAYDEQDENIRLNVNNGSTPSGKYRVVKDFNGKGLESDGVTLANSDYPYRGYLYYAEFEIS